MTIETQNTHQLSSIIVEAVLRDLRGRKGFRHVLDELDEETRDEIECTLVGKVYKEVSETAFVAPWKKVACDLADALDRQGS